LTVYRLNPLTDSRWSELVARHPRASIFHTRGWLDALRRTYGYEPVAFTTSPPDAALRNAMVFCQIRSWLTGRRLVSLPFSDHCDPLVDNADDGDRLWTQLQTERSENGWRYIEVRPTAIQGGVPAAFGRGKQFCLHVLDLRPDRDVLFRSFHKDSTQRKIRRAEREGLVYEDGHTEELLRAFYGLVLMTRRRQQLPPQPFSWFLNLAACVPEAMTVRLARHGGRPIAGILTLRHRDHMVYKYGASDVAFHNLGGMHLLFWKAIQDARALGCVALDLGRSDLEDSGLLTFKDRWGAARVGMTYLRHPVPQSETSPMRHWMIRCAEEVFSLVPSGFRTAAGRLLYKHVG
jgi:hypothetical protein